MNDDTPATRRDADAAPPAGSGAPAVERGAVFDPSRRYRYLLTRRWAPAGAAVAFVMLNPSRADARRDDPTIRRCMGFARAWGYGAVEVVNLFAYRTPSPARLRRARRPVGAENDAYLERAVRTAACVVLAWGIHGGLHGRDRAVLSLLGETGVRLDCLGLTRAGHPRHVLYLPGGLAPRPYRPQG